MPGPIDSGASGVGTAANLGPLPKGMLTFAKAAAGGSDPVLITGETGSGKSFLARLIHGLSPRAPHPFISSNVSSVAPGLFEREYFGHVPGAFTDARKGAPGLFEAASPGTLLLDEIGELPLSLQPKLLAAIEDRAVRRLGSTALVPVDLRIMAATSADLEAMVASDRFRADLFFRIAVLTFHVPPLRRRTSQLPELIARFLDLICQEQDRGAIQVLDEAMDLLLSYPWPGNLRELESTLRHGATFARNASIHPENLPARIRRGTWTLAPKHWQGPGWTSRYQAPAELSAERDRILRALTKEDGNRTRAARRLGMARSTLYQKLAIHGLDD